MGEGVKADELSGRVALVTGASRGIGAATARALASAGAAVALGARGMGALTTLAEDITGQGGRALAVELDVSDRASVEEAVAGTRARFGAIDILINNAGVITPIGRVGDCDPGEWARSIEINLTGAFNCVHAVLPGMCAAGGGDIVNLSSGAAHKPLEGWSAYCCGKAGLAMLTRALAGEYAADGVRVYGFAPGLVDTGMQAAIRASGVNPVSRLARSELGAAGAPAAVIAFLCTPGGRPFAGREIDIRDPELRRAAGLEARA